MGKESEMNLIRRIYAYWLMIHPFPVMMVIMFATILALATARETLDPSRLVRAIATLFFSQVVVGVSNDYHDRALDLHAQPYKPLARGIVTPHEALALIAIASVLMLAFGISLGPLVLALALLGTFAGQLYNFLLRGTPFSWFPYVLGFITLPIFIWVAMERFDVKQLALVPVGLPLLFGVHLAQTLPDIESDARVGVRGFAVALGRERGLIVAWSACIAAQLLALVSAILLNSIMQIVLVAIFVSFALVVLSIARFHRNPSSATLRGNFRLIAPSAVILTAGWLFALKT